MASRAYPQPAPLELALSIIPSLPRPILSRLVARMIDRLDELDGDGEAEDDDPAGGALDDEGEASFEGVIPIYSVDQSRGPMMGSA